MSKQKLTDDQQSRINAIMKTWHEEIDKIPEMPENNTHPTFSCHYDRLAQAPYKKLRDKYMPMIQKIKEENNGEG